MPSTTRTSSLALALCLVALLLMVSLIIAPLSSARAGEISGGAGIVTGGSYSSERDRTVRRYRIEAMQTNQEYIDALNYQIDMYTVAIIFASTLDVYGKLSRIALTGIKTVLFGPDATSLAHAVVTGITAYEQIDEIRNEMKSLQK